MTLIDKGIFAYPEASLILFVFVAFCRLQWDAGSGKKVGKAVSLNVSVSVLLVHKINHEGRIYILRSESAP